MSKVIVRPKVYRIKEVYWAYVHSLLLKHPDWETKYGVSLSMRQCFVYGPKANGKGVELKMSWPLFKEITDTFFRKAKTAVIQGEVLRLGKGAGTIRGVRIEQNYRNPAINWGATVKLNKRNENGKLMRVYYLGDDYCRIEWRKDPRVDNIRKYNFDPAKKNVRTGKGFTLEFAEAHRANPLLKYKYKYYPIKKKKYGS